MRTRKRATPAAAPPPEARAPQPPTLAEQKTDFTAEGSPPPGRVANMPPIELPEDEAAPSKRVSRARYP